MGTSGTGLFADDVACDVRDQYLDLLAGGAAPGEARLSLQRAWVGAHEDVDEAPIFWLALAATQWRYGVLEPEVRDRALGILDRGGDLARWAGSKAIARRAKVLADLRRTLESAQPPARRPRRRRPERPAAHALRSPSGRSTATVWEVAARGTPFGPTAQVIVETDGAVGRGGGNVCVVRCAYDEVVLTWDGDDMLVVRYPPGTALENERPTFFFSGTSIRCRFEAIGGA